jgi:Ca2+-transporting ATPase
MRYGPGAKANTLLFNSLTIAQLLHAYSTRSDHFSIYSKEKLSRNQYLDLAAGGTIALQVLAMVVPGMRKLFGSTPIGLLDTLVIAGGASAPFVINEFIKEINQKKQQKPLRRKVRRSKSKDKEIVI